MPGLSGVGSVHKGQDAPVAITTLRNGAAYPKADSYETQSDFIISVDVPGASKGDVKLDADGGRLTVRWHKTPGKDEDGARFLLRESFSGVFTRTFSLPDTANTDAISAEVKDGVLTIRVPKQEPIGNRRIDVTVS